MTRKRGLMYYRIDVCSVLRLRCCDTGYRSLIPGLASSRPKTRRCELETGPRTKDEKLEPFHITASKDKRCGD
jgi:hypothetical protein